MDQYKRIIKRYNLEQLRAVFSEVKFAYKLYSSKYRVLLNEIKKRVLLEKTIKEEDSDLEDKSCEVDNFLKTIDNKFLDRFNKEEIKRILTRDEQ